MVVYTREWIGRCQWHYSIRALCLATNRIESVLAGGAEKSVHHCYWLVFKVQTSITHHLNTSCLGSRQKCAVNTVQRVLFPYI